MPEQPNNTQPVAPQGVTPKLETADIPGVEIFDVRSQEARARGYSDKDADDIVLAGSDLAAFFVPSVTLGHPEPWSGHPKLGLIQNIRKHAQKAGTLVADFVNVPMSIVPWIQKRLFDKVSAEIYRDVEAPNGKKYSSVLRSVGLLGADIPVVKELAGLPVAFGEAAGKSVFCKGGIETLVFKEDKLSERKEVTEMPEKIEMPIEERDRLIASAKQAEKFAEQIKALETQVAKVGELQSQLDAKTKEAEKFAEDLKVERSKATAMQTAATKSKVDAFCETVKKTGRILPAQEPKLRLVAGLLDDLKTEKFGEGETAVSGTALDCLIALGMSIPESQAVKFAELSHSHEDAETRDNVEGAINIDWLKRAEKYAEDKKVPLEVAIVATARKGDELHPSEK